MKKIGVLTGGGDCPGLNATIRAVVKKGINEYNYEICGILAGWKGLKGNEIIPIELKEIIGRYKTVDGYWYDLAKVFSG